LSRQSFPPRQPTVIPSMRRRPHAHLKEQIVA
jgi:hypothetical protein